MKIDKVAGGHIPQAQLNQTSKTATKTRTVKKSHQPSVHANIAALEQAQAEMAQMPDVDMDKVDEIRNALKNGEISLDMDALAKAVQRFHQGHD